MAGAPARRLAVRVGRLEEAAALGALRPVAARVPVVVSTRELGQLALVAVGAVEAGGAETARGEVEDVAPPRVVVVDVP